MTVSGYDLREQLSQTDWYTLYRGVGPIGDSPVLVKASRGTPAASDAQPLRQEYELFRALAAPGFPRALDLFQLNGASWLVLEDPGGVLLSSLAPSLRADLGRFFQVAIALCTLLEELHRRELAQHSVRPDGVLVHPTTIESWVVDLSFAAPSSAAAKSPLGTRLPAALLPYCSPELTGRMNREIDYRSDFYSLGVTLYELLTGAPPFESGDSLELIHWHLAKAPTPPSQVNPEIPQAVSEIVLKLLSKTADSRYQSALGLRHDLEICSRQWQTQRSIVAFPLGRKDVSDRFLIPQRLYGREQEVARLLGVFDQVRNGGSVLALVAGYSGIGKTSLVQELYRPIVQHRGYFISGKFDQVLRHRPFGALIQAFRRLIRQLLGESEASLERWRSKFSHALGVNAGVLTEVIPELELIIGSHPPPAALDPAESLNRFQMVFRDFLGVLAREEHPLVLFLDDLQWADSATLSLLHPLLTSPEILSLLLIGAYRDNEVGDGDPLPRAIEMLERAGATVRRLTLGPLSKGDLGTLIGDTLRRQATAVEPLTALVQKNTEGNPFFVIQFLKTLYHDGLVKFDHDLGRWDFRMAAIGSMGVTENVVDLMTRKIQQLPADTQRILRLAACLGNQFDLESIAATNEQSLEAAAESLSHALQIGLLVNAGERQAPPTAESGDLQPPVPTYAFLHDRVQQAAYALIAEQVRPQAHLNVGRILLKRWDPAEEEKIFEVVQQLNLGRDLISHETERLQVARLNLTAARKAKSSTAYQAALGYLQVGLQLAGEGAWDAHYELMFSLQIEAAECEYLCGDFVAADRRFALLRQKARTDVDRVAVYNLQVLQHENTSAYGEAVRTGREGLRLLGVSFPDTEAEKQAALEAEVSEIRTLLGERPIASLIDLPAMTDPQTRSVMKLLTTLWAPAYIAGDQILTRLISATMARLSLLHGNSEESAYGYVTHAITVGSVLGDYQAGHEFGKLALAVNDRFRDPKRRAKVHHMFSCFVNVWREPMESCFPHSREACRGGLETGDFAYANYGAFHESWYGFLTSSELERFFEDYQPNVALLHKIKVTSFAETQKVILNWGRALAGSTAGNLSLSREDFDEDAYLAAYRDDAFFMTFFWVVKLYLCVTFEEYGRAREAASQARQVVQTLGGTIWPVLLEFLEGLTLAGLYPEANPQEQAATRRELATLCDSLAVRAENCPENFRCWYLLLSAERSRLERHDLQAIDLYEEAIRYARGANRIACEALGNELQARFWRGRGNPVIADFYLEAARGLYAQWGAAAKLRDLEQRYGIQPKAASALGAAGASREASPRAEALENTAGALDLATVAKAAQAIAREIELPVLLERLMKIALENAGAQRGVFLQEREGALLVQAEAAVDLDNVSVLLAAPLEARGDLSQAVIQYVRKTAEAVLLGDAAQDERFGAEPYVAASSHLSILCVPVVHQGKPEGILYLENRLAGETFTPERTKVISMLAAQAAISLENARLYEEAKQEATRRERAEQMLRSVVEGTAAATGTNFFRSLVRHLAAALEVRYAFVTECRLNKTRARMLAFWKAGDFGENAEYDVAATPCRIALEGEISYYAQGVQAIFPGDQDLATLGAESYLGIPLFASTGQLIGHLAVLDDKRMGPSEQRLSVVKTFAARAGAELERLQAERELQAALAEVERLKNQLEAENVYLQEEIRHEHNFEEIVGGSPALLEMLSQVEQVAPTDSTVLICGETGTGKELIARAIHSRSSRRHRPLVKVNCGAISAGLVESELFGHVRGAFTGAVERRTGRFELAHGGTIFLDEVGELPPETQVKLLRVLQEQEFEPVGSSRTVQVDVRVIAATNLDLQRAVDAGRFRADLFYRLNVLPLKAPPLRDRTEDIPQLVTFFLAHFSNRFGKKVDRVSQETLERLMRYPWPGNVRELQNVIERAVVLAQGSVLVLDQNLLPQPAARPSVAERPAPPMSADGAATADGGEKLPPAALLSALPPSTPPATLEQVEKGHILRVLTETDWVIEGPKGAAKILKLHPNTLRSRLKKLGIRRPSHEMP